MGREIRRVPAHWQHPKSEQYKDRLQPMYDQTFAEAAAEWKVGLSKWEAGERPDYISDESRGNEYWEYHGAPPDRECYRPWLDHEATWFQLWETVSEGTPVTPPFETAEELIEYLAKNGDEWDQSRCKNIQTCRLFGMTPGQPGWGRARAEAFVKAGWAPSMMVSGGAIMDSKDIPLAMEQSQ